MITRKHYSSKPYIIWRPKRNDFRINVEGIYCADKYAKFGVMEFLPCQRHIDTLRRGDCTPHRRHVNAYIRRRMKQ